MFFLFIFFPTVDFFRRFQTVINSSFSVQRRSNFACHVSYSRSIDCTLQIFRFCPRSAVVALGNWKKFQKSRFFPPFSSRFPPSFSVQRRSNFACHVSYSRSIDCTEQTFRFRPRSAVVALGNWKKFQKSCFFSTFFQPFSSVVFMCNDVQILHATVPISVPSIVQSRICRFCPRSAVVALGSWKKIQKSRFSHVAFNVVQEVRMSVPEVMLYLSEVTWSSQFRVGPQSYPQVPCGYSCLCIYLREHVD